MNKRLLPVAAAAVIGVAGLSLIKHYEGVRFNAYRDAVGIPTICYGHTGPDVRMGMTASQATCDRLLMQDVQKHQVVIIPGNPKNCVRNAMLTANERDAVTSFTFNVGTKAFCKSTMARKIKARDFAGAANEFPKWNKAKGKVYPGLTKRRAAERALYLSNQRSEPNNTLSGRVTALLMDLS